jgi:hypothetical protein
MRTTKSVWPMRGAATPTIGGSTCEDPAYLDWVRALHSAGFEIGLHNVTYHTSTRSETLRGFERFEELFGHPPRCLANHADCGESIHWGTKRLTGIHVPVYKLLTRFKYDTYHGDEVGSELFWGDVCKEKVDFVRNFVFGDINTLKVCPVMPYSDPERPYVNEWFASSEGPDVTTFSEMLAEANQDRLEAEGGACIMYTHFASGFAEAGRVDPRFEQLMRRLSEKNGWFVPVGTLLDFLRQRNGAHVITRKERAALERQWLAHKIRVRGTT